MSDLFLYLTMAVIGYFIGSKLQHKQDDLKITGKIQTYAICIMVFFMGLRMGSNEEVINNLNMIGLYALILTVVILICSLAAVTVTRRILGIDRFGDIKSQKIHEVHDEILEEEAETGETSNKMTIIILILVAVGMVIGHYTVKLGMLEYEGINYTGGLVIRYGLCLLLFLVGMDLGLEGNFVKDVREAGLRIFAIPCAVVIGTLAGAALCSLFLPISVKESLAVGSGFGWYSLAPVIIMDKGLMTVSAIAFMHNVLRTLSSLMLIPFVAKKIGYVDAVGLPGACALDVCLPIIVKSTKGSIAIYSFVTGVTICVLVPVLVPLWLS